MAYLIELIVSLVLILEITLSNQKCSCPVDYEKVTFDSGVAIGKLNDLVFQNKAYNVFIVKDYLVFNKTIPMTEQSTTDITNVCPTGFKIADWTALSQIAIANSTDNVPIITTLGLANANYLVSSTKSYPSFLSGSVAESWQFKSYLMTSSKNFKESNYSTYFQYNKNNDDTNPNRLLCILDDSQLSFYSNPYDYVINRNYAAKILGDYYLSGQWKIDGVKYNSLNTQFKFSTTGCKTIEAWGYTQTKKTIYNCAVVYANTPTAFANVTKTLASESIQKFELDDTSLEINFLFFNRVNVALTPKSDGGFYIFYSDSTKNAKVVSFDSNYKQIGSAISVASNTFPLDIIETSDGFIVFCKNSESNALSFIKGFKSDGTLAFTKNVINNGELPTTAVDQITFFDDQGVALDGTQSMFSTQNGKLSYGREKVGLIFAHYNYFGMKNGARNDHTGDTFYMFDQDGTPASYAWSWATSHSLNQASYYNSRYFVTASLGDMYPKNIQVCIAHLNEFTSAYDLTRKKNVKNQNYCASIITNGIIPGDGSGNSVGRIGGIFSIAEVFYLVYSRGSSSLGGQADSNGEIGLIRFGYDPSLVKDNFINTKSFNLGSSQNVVNIRSSRYGNKIVLLIAFSKTAVPSGQDSPNKYVKDQQTMSVWVIDIIDPTKIDKFDYPDFIVPTTEDIKTLKDGTIAWGYVNSTTKKVGVAYIKLDNSSVDFSLDYIPDSVPLPLFSVNLIISYAMLILLILVV